MKKVSILYVCSGNTCHGIINNGNEEKNNTLKNETLICNSKACIIKPKNDDDCIIQVSNCSNCSEIKLYCFNGYCVGGPSNNDGKNNNNGTSTNGSSTSESSTSGSSTSGSSTSGSSTSGSSTSGSNNPSNDETITVISCLDGFCEIKLMILMKMMEIVELFVKMENVFLGEKKKLLRKIKKMIMIIMIMIILKFI